MSAPRMGTTKRERWYFYIACKKEDGKENGYTGSFLYLFVVVLCSPSKVSDTKSVIFGYMHVDDKVVIYKAGTSTRTSLS